MEGLSSTGPTPSSFTYLLFILRLRWFVCRGLSLSAADDQLSFVCINPFGCLFVLHVAFRHVMSAAIFFFLGGLSRYYILGGHD